MLAALVAASATASAASVTVQVGRDDPQNGAAYLRYFPETAVVWEGDEVVWQAASNTPHTVTSPPGQAGAFDSSPGIRLDDPAFAASFGPGGFLMPAQSFNQTFDKPGSFLYLCKIHPGMVGRITVVNATAGAPSGGTGLPIGGTGGNASRPEPGLFWVAVGWGSGDTTVDRFAPDDLTVPVGSKVVWVNLHSGEPHTVTGWPANQAPARGAPPSSQPAFDSSPNVGPPPPAFESATGIMDLDGPNKEFRRTFADAGHYLYVCKLHPGMWGTVVVLEKPGGNASTEGGGGTVRSDSGSRIPGLALPLVLGGLALAALVARRRS